MSTTTTTLGLTKPALSAGDVWGDDINDNFDTIDTFATDTIADLADKAALSHTHVATAITNFDEAVDDRVSNLLTAGTNVTLTYDDTMGTLTVDSTGGASVTGAARFDTLAAVASATIDSGVKTLSTGGFATAGDKGQGTYVRMAAAPTSPTNKAYTRSVDRYKFDGTTDATHGGYWQLVPDAGAVTIEQFGGAGDTPFGATLDTVPVFGTDNYQPFLDALAYYSHSYTPATPDINFYYEIKFGSGRYYMSQTGGVNIYSVVKVSGVGGMHDPQGTGMGTVWVFPAGAHGVIIHNSNTSSVTGATPTGSAGGTVFEGISLDFPGSTEDLTKVAVHMRGQATLSRVAVYRAPGLGFYLHATAGAGGAEEGNVNDWAIRDCSVYSCFGDALYVKGADANGGSCAGFVSGPGTVGGCGVRCESYLPNVFSGLQISSYGGYDGGQGVYHLGGRYVLIDPTAGALTSSTGVTPGTNNRKWYKTGAAGAASAQYPQWVDDGSHTLGLQIYDSGTGSYYLNPYVENGGAGVTHVIGSAHIIGGTAQATIYSNLQQNSRGSPNENPTDFRQGVGSYIGFDTNAQPDEYTQNGTFVSVRVGGTANGHGLTGQISSLVMSIAREKDGSGNPWYWGYWDADMRFSQLGGLPIWEITTATTAQQFGTGAAQANKLVLWSPVIKDSVGTGRVLTMSPTIPSSGAHAEGEIAFSNAPSAGGNVGWICTAAGTPGTWKKFGAIQGTNAYTPTNVSTDRSYDANATTTDELADVLGTLIADLQAAGVLA
jgi:hypothetical protein